MNHEINLIKKLSGADSLNRLLRFSPGSDSRLAMILSGLLGKSGLMYKERSTVPVEPKVFKPTLSGKKPVWILYGTHTGNSEQLSEETAEKLKALGLDVKVSDMESFRYEDLPGIKTLLVIVSTDGDGEPPLVAEEFLEYLNGSQAPRLNHLKYSVLALGDTCYYQFCQAGKDFDSLLEKSGATRLTERVDCDVDYEDDYARWINDVISKLKKTEVSKHLK